MRGASWRIFLKPTILMLPGHLCDERVWAPVADALTSAGWPVLHVPLDHGDVDQMADAALASAEGPVIAAGFSMGAIVSLAMLRVAPERVCGLTLMGVNAGPDLPDRAATRLIQQKRARCGDLEGIVTTQMAPHYLTASRSGDASLLALFRSMATKIGMEAFLRQSEALRLRPDARPSLGRIGCPALVACGMEDRLCPPAWHVDTAAAIPGSELAVVDDAGHMLPLEQPEHVAGLMLDWLARRIDR